MCYSFEALNNGLQLLFTMYSVTNGQYRTIPPGLRVNTLKI